MTRAEFSRKTNRVHHSRKKRAKLFHDKGGICHLCGGKVQPGEAWDVSHPIPLALGGADDESNWDVAHRKCHRVHTAKEDVPRIAKATRQHDRFHGIITPKGTLRGQGFNRPPPQRRASKPLNRPTLPHQGLYK